MRKEFILITIILMLILTGCKFPHEHKYIEGKCDCGEEDNSYTPPHEHKYIEGKCDCGEEDNSYTPPHKHKYIDGECQCGLADDLYIVIDTYNEYSSSISSAVVLKISMKKEYNIDDKYEIKISYGHLYNDLKENECLDNTLTVLQIFLSKDLNEIPQPLDGLLSGYLLVDVNNFLTSQYSIDYDVINGIKKNFIYKSKTFIEMSKDNLIENSGIICISLCSFSLSEDNNLTGKYQGGRINLYYQIEDNKIMFKEMRSNDEK